MEHLGLKIMRVLYSGPSHLVGQFLGSCGDQYLENYECNTRIVEKTLVPRSFYTEKKLG